MYIVHTTGFHIMSFQLSLSRQVSGFLDGELARFSFPCHLYNNIEDLDAILLLMKLLFGCITYTLGPFLPNYFVMNAC